MFNQTTKTNTFKIWSLSTTTATSDPTSKVSILPTILSTDLPSTQPSFVHKNSIFQCVSKDRETKFKNQWLFACCV